MFNFLERWQFVFFVAHQSAALAPNHDAPRHRSCIDRKRYAVAHRAAAVCANSFTVHIIGLIFSST